jgi:cytochrome bd-type quinol oxidase subunit 2
MKNSIKKTFVFLILMSLFIVPALALAQSTPTTPTQPNHLLQTLANVAQKGGYEVDATKASTPKLVGLIIRAFLNFLGITFLILMILAGYSWMTAEGNDEQITKAKRTIKQSIIGLVIAISAWTLWVFIFERLIIMTK